LTSITIINGLRAVVSKDPGSAYGIHFPDCPGLYTAGDTMEELFANAHEVTSIWLEMEHDDQFTGTK
jgi:predicted RNase H-like HicB family nuclease